ncbi:hypothetical protein [Dokdonia sp.]
MNDEPACRQAGNLITILLELLLASCVISPRVYPELVEGSR